MALVFISENSSPNYIAVSTDIVDSKIDGANIVGKTVFTTDDSTWYIIKKDLTLSPYNMPVEISGEITIGEVAQGAASLTEAWLVDGSGVTQPVSGDFLTDTELRATPVPVTGVLTDTQLRATPVPTSTSNGLTDTQLRATPVPITTDGLTDTELRATPVEVEATKSVVDTNNSTAETLSGNAEYTGTWTELTDYTNISIMVTTDVDSASLGLHIHWSTNGVNEDDIDEFTIYGGTSKQYTFGVTSKYYRVHYTNGSSAQATFRLQSMLHTHAPKPSSHRLDSDLIAEDDAELQRSVMVTDSGDGKVFKNVSVQNPMPSDGDAVYAKDLYLPSCSATGFAITGDPGATASEIIRSIVSDHRTEKKNSGATNPKSITLAFHRPVLTTSFGLDSSLNSGDFSNVKVYGKQSNTEILLIDESSSSTKYNVRVFSIEPTKLSAIRFEFHTADAVSVGMIGIFKHTEVAARIQALNPAGEVVDVKATSNNTFLVGVGDIQSDAGFRVRVSQLTTLGDYKVNGYDREEMWENGGSGTGTWGTNKYQLSVTSGQYRYRTTRRFHPYFSGKSQLVEETFIGFAPQSNVTKRIGYFSSNAVAPFNSTLDGFWLESSGGSILLKATRAGTSTLSKDITTWSGYENLSEYQTLATWDNFTVVVFDFLWLGGAVLRLWVKTSKGFVLAHEFHYSGTAADVFILTPNQPLRYDIYSSTGSGSLTYVCAQCATEGSINESGSSRFVRTASTISLGSAGTIYPVKAIRKQASYRDLAVLINHVDAILTSANDYAAWELQFNPTLSAPLTYAALANSPIEQANGNGTITVTSSGIIVAGGSLRTGASLLANQLEMNYLSWLGGTLNNTMDEIVFCIIPISGAVTAWGGIGFKIF